MAMPTKLGSRHMYDPQNPHKWEPQRQNNFEIQIVDLDSIIQGAGEIFTLSVANFNPPGVSISPISVPYGNNKTKFPGTPEYDDVNVTIQDFIGADMEKILDAWWHTVYDEETQSIKFASNFKRDAYIIEYSPDGTISRQWDLHGCWLSSYKPGALNQETGLRQIDANIACDYFTLGDRVGI